MPATPIATVTRTWATGTTVWLYVVTMANYLVPTRAELDLGTDLTREVRDNDGFTTKADDINTPDGASTYVGTIPGAVTSEESSLTVYLDPTGVDFVRSAWTQGAVGHVVRMEGGDVAGRLMDIFPTRVKTVGKMIKYHESEAIRAQAFFSITRKPAENVVIPA